MARHADDIKMYRSTKKRRIIKKYSSVQYYNTDAFYRFTISRYSYRCAVSLLPFLLLEICMPRNRRASVLRPEKFEYKLGCIKITSLGRHRRFRASLRPFHRNPRTYLPGASKTFPSPGILFGCSSLYPSPRVVCLHVPLCSSRRIPLASSHTLPRSLNMHTYILSLSLYDPLLKHVPLRFLLLRDPLSPILPESPFNSTRTPPTYRPTWRRRHLHKS